MNLNEKLTNELVAEYVRIFKNPIYKDLIKAIIEDQYQSTPKNNVGLSNILLGFIPEHYATAENKILIVGRETRGWLSGQVFNCYNEEEIITSMNYSKKHFYNNLSKRKSKTSFFGLIKKIAKKSGVNGLLWANIFAIDCKETNPNNSHFFTTIKQLSKELLKAQIDILKPDFILFVNGVNASVRIARKEYFEHLNWTGKGFGDLDKRYLEQCFLYPNNNSYQPICYRTYHPAFRKNKNNITAYNNAQKGLATLIEILPSKTKSEQD